ncbi:zinc finger MYM-type protein 1-like protein [Tanacetum coccineum]
MKEIMGRTDILSQALQKKNQDIVNAIDLVSATKESLNDFRNNGWDCFREKVLILSEKHQIDTPDMNALYKSSRYRPRQKDNHFTFEHYYRAEVFVSILDKQLLELNNRFNEHAMDLLTLGSALVPKNDSNSYIIDEICLLVEKYYPADFTEQERLRLSSELEIFNIERSKNPKLSKVSTIVELCKVLVETKKPERGFSAMKICKSRLRNRKSDDFLVDSLVVYIEKEVAENFDSESLIDEFKKLKGRRADFLKDVLEYEEQLHETEVATDEAYSIFDEENALDEAASEAWSSKAKQEDVNLEQALN